MVCHSFRKDNGFVDAANWWGVAPLLVSFRYALHSSVILDPTNISQGCIFCPNGDGAFKQTTAMKWAHLLCAMWIPEVSLGNVTFQEPVQDVEKVPKTRWKLVS